FIVCAAPNETLPLACTPSEIGAAVIARFDAGKVRGNFFADSRNHDRRYAIALDAVLTNASAAPVDGVDAWSVDGDEAGIAFSKLMAAAATKDAETLRSLSMPEREHDWDHFGIITSIQRTARQEPRVIAASRQGAIMHLWVLPTAGDGTARLPFRVD